MIKNMYKFIFVLFLILYGSISNTFADLNLSIPIEQIYEVTEDGLDGLKFSSKFKVPGYAKIWLNTIPEFPTSNKVEWDNPYWYIKFDNSIFYSSDTLAYLVAFNFKICGANWLTYGNEQAINDYNKAGGCEAGNCSAFANIKKYYPTRGAFNGSYKFEVNKCVRNINDCDGVVALERCQKGNNDNTCQPVDGGNYFTQNDRVFRENMYDGEEIINYACIDPRPEAKNYDIFRGEEQAYQTYYMRGYDYGNYLCERYLEKRTRAGDEFDVAYQCCLKAQQSVCIYQNEKNNLATFCSIYSNKCKINNIDFNNASFCWFYPDECAKYNMNTEKLISGNIVFKVFQNFTIDSPVEDTNRYCIRTYNLVPSNINLEGGADYATSVFERIPNEDSMKACQDSGDYANCEIQYDKDDCNDNGVVYPLCEGKNKNFFQYNRHCTQVSNNNIEFIYANTYSPYLDKACLNLVGNSHNTTGYASYSAYNRAVDLYPKTIFAPAVECVVETMKNLLLNKAGHTRCKVISETPNYMNECESGEIFKAGQEFDTNIVSSDGVDSYKHPLQDIIRYTKNITYMFIAFAISLYGYNVLIKGGALGSRYDIVMLIVKISFIVALTVNTSWYNLIFKFTYALNDLLFSTVSKIGFETLVDEHGNLVRDDGCYFGDITSLRFTDDSPEIIEAIAKYDNNYDDYPSDRRYVSFFDTLDCKIAKYFGYSTFDNGTGWGIVKLYVLSIIWPFGLGLFIGFISMFLGITLFIFALKIVYIYVASMIAITILLFLSPIIIPTLLFKKFSGIFQKWLKNVIGYAIQPFVMVAFVSISIMIIDNFMLGSGLFTGSGPNKELVCGFACYDQDTGDLVAYTSKRNAFVSYYLNAEINDLEKQGISQEQKDLEMQKIWINVLDKLKGNADLKNCKSGDKIIDIKRDSPLCLMSNISTDLLFGIIFRITDVVINDVISLLSILILVVVLDNMLNRVPRIASTLTGSAAIPGLGADVNPMVVAGKAVQTVLFVKRLTVGAVKKIVNKSSTSKLREKVAAQKEQNKE